jgi:two-component system LytT family sensor kinase
VLQEPKFLSAGQFLLTTLVVKLAAMAALATMLARYRRFGHMKVNWQVLLLMAPIGLELVRQMVGARYPLRLFHLSSPEPWLTLFVYVAAILTVSTPIKIWNNARIEHRLQEQEKLLLAAKVEALKSQINPHFLFNTLTSVSSLIRSQPETARAVIQKLSGLLRKLMQSQEQFVTLREELEAIDEYLDIEVVRFGSRLCVKKSIAPDTLDVIVPSLLLQPLVENCIKHGFARKVGPGTITITSRREGDFAVIEIEDDGLGISDERVPLALSSGIGLSNVNERMRVLYGAQGRFALVGSPGKGAVARVEIPLALAIEERITA